MALWALVVLCWACVVAQKDLHHPSKTEFGKTVDAGVNLLMVNGELFDSQSGDPVHHPDSAGKMVLGRDGASELLGVWDANSDAAMSIAVYRYNTEKKAFEKITTCLSGQAGIVRVRVSGYAVAAIVVESPRVELRFWTHENGVCAPHAEVSTIDMVISADEVLSFDFAAARNHNQVSYAVIGTGSEGTTGTVHFAQIRHGAPVPIEWVRVSEDALPTLGRAVCIQQHVDVGNGAGLVAAVASNDTVVVFRLKDLGVGAPFHFPQLQILAKDLEGYTATLTNPSLAAGRHNDRDLVLIGSPQHDNGWGSAIYLSAFRGEYNHDDPAVPTQWMVSAFLVGRSAGSLFGTSVAVGGNGFTYIGAPATQDTYEYEPDIVTGGIHAPAGYVPKGANLAPAAPAVGKLAPPPSLGGVGGEPAFLHPDHPSGGFHHWSLWIFAILAILALLVAALVVAVIFVKNKKADGGDANHAAVFGMDEMTAVERPSRALPGSSPGGVSPRGNPSPGGVSPQGMPKPPGKKPPPKKKVTRTVTTTSAPAPAPAPANDKTLDDDDDSGSETDSSGTESDVV